MTFITFNLIVYWSGNLRTLNRQAAQNLVLANPAETVPTDKAVQYLQEGEDESYVDSYSHFSIHQDMLQVQNLSRI